MVRSRCFPALRKDLFPAIGAIDVTELREKQDTESLQKLLPNVTFCDLEAEDLTGVDRNFVRLFKLAQLMLEYVLMKQEELLENTSTSEEKLAKSVEVRDAWAVLILFPVSSINTSQKHNSLLQKYEDLRKQHKTLKKSFTTQQRLHASSSQGYTSFTVNHSNLTCPNE